MADNYDILMYRSYCCKFLPGGLYNFHWISRILTRVTAPALGENQEYAANGDEEIASSIDYSDLQPASRSEFGKWQTESWDLVQEAGILPFLVVDLSKYPCSTSLTPSRGASTSSSPLITMGSINIINYHINQLINAFRLLSDRRGLQLWLFVFHPKRSDRNLQQIYLQSMNE